jgi:glutamate synthase (NADPH) large chain
MEPWDGPAAIAFTDGRSIGATLDRNGCARRATWSRNDDLVIMASETGVLPVKPEDVKLKGRLQPGKMLLVDTVEGRIVSDKEIKRSLYGRNPYQLWLKENQITLDNCRAAARARHRSRHLLLRQRAFGYTDEDLR